MGAKLLLDGCQSAPRMALDMTALGCDFYVFSGHKLYGPTGIGVLWGRKNLLEDMPPWQGGGAMIEKGAAIDASAVELKGLDVEKASIGDMTTTLKGADGLVIAVGFVPGNPFKMNAAANAVDNVGTVKLIDAAKAAGVKKVVLVSSILTDAGAWGQLDSAGYKITNAFGAVLEEKLVAEKCARAAAEPRRLRRAQREPSLPWPRVLLRRSEGDSAPTLAHGRRACCCCCCVQVPARERPRLDNCTPGRSQGRATDRRALRLG